MKKESDIFDRIRGALYGVAVSDALGGPVEFLRAKDIQALYGAITEMEGGGWLDLEPGEVTDDTQMTIAVARGILEAPDDPVPAIGQNFIEWYNSAPKDIGMTCALAIRAAKELGASSRADWLKAGLEAHRTMNGKSGGNGALMRTIYPALYYTDPKELDKNVADISSMTHFSVENALICKEYCHAVRSAILGRNPIHTISLGIFYEPDADPTGYIINTWSNVIDSIFGAANFENSVIAAVNRGGDADTIGAITGGLAGAYYGYKSIPQRWLDFLDPDLKSELDQLAEAAYQANEKYYSTAFETAI